MLKYKIPQIVTLTLNISMLEWLCSFYELLNSD